MSIVKVKVFVPHEDGVHAKTQDAYVDVPDSLLEEALKEKKACKSLDFYCFKFKWGTLINHNNLCEYIQRKVGRFDWQSIERIHIH